jgi:DNA polymerase-3 subunit chi
VLIVAPGTAVAPRPLVINLRDEVAPPGFERVLEVVPADESARGPLRRRWSAYKELGLDLQKHDM